MRILELLQERRIQRTVYMYHGTSSRFLRSILKHGLLPDPGHTSWVGHYNLASLGGVYMSIDHDTAVEAARAAVNKHGGEPIIIQISVVTDSGTPDEDDVINTILNATYRTYKDRTGYYSDPVRDSARMLRGRFKMSKNSVEIIRNIVIVTMKILKQDGYGQNLNSIDAATELQKQPKIREYTAELLRTMRPLMSIDSEPNVRITRPIGFRGKTRIVKIADLNSGRTLYPRTNIMVP